MHTPRHYPLHLIIVPIMELALMLAIAAYITTIDMNLLYLLSIPLGASIAYFLSPRTIEDYYDPDYRVRAEIAKLGHNLHILMHDKDWRVRKEVAKQGYGLLTLQNDANKEVSDTAKRLLKRGSC